MTGSSLLTFIGTALLLVPATARAAEKAPARFEPPAGKVLVFVGQDNEAVGGTEKFKNGYVDNVGVPGGITHYVYFSEGWTNGFKRTFAKGSVAGLNTETEWAAGPMHQKAYLDSPKLASCVMHVSISMEGNSEDKVADGSFDHLIAEFVRYINDNIDVIRAVSYINADWDAQEMWDGWGQTRIETAPRIKTRWLEKMAEPRFVNADDKPFEVIGFK